MWAQIFHREPIRANFGNNFPRGWEQASYQGSPSGVPKKSRRAAASAAEVTFLKCAAAKAGY
jgi:hypothetical protein